jgi:hypothetical protein
MDGQVNSHWDFPPTSSMAVYGGNALHPSLPLLFWSATLNATSSFVGARHSMQWLPCGCLDRLMLSNKAAI